MGLLIKRSVIADVGKAVPMCMAQINILVHDPVPYSRDPIKIIKRYITVFYVNTRKQQN